MGVDLTELLRVFGDSLKRSMFGVLAGTIESFDAGPPALADVLVGTRRPIPDDEEIVSHEALPVLPACRVIFPTSNGASITWELRKGDPCVVLVTSFNEANFWATGKVSDAGDIRVHHPGSALVLAGFNLDVPSTPGTGGVVVSVPTGATIKLGGPAAADFVALSSKVDLRFAAIEAGFSTKLAGPGTALPIGPSTAALKVQAE